MQSEVIVFRPNMTHVTQPFSGEHTAPSSLQIRAEAGPKLMPLVSDAPYLRQWARYRAYIPEIQKTILSLRLRGLAIQRIQSEIRDRCGACVTAGTVASIRSDQLKITSQWRGRRLKTTYDMVYWSAVRVKVLEYGLEVRPLYFAVGIAQDGALDILGVWLERRNDSDFWNRCMMELRNHGLSDILIGIVDRESAFTALQSIYPSTLAYVVPSEMFKGRSGKRKRSGGAQMLRTLPDAVHLFIESIDPFKSLIAKLRRGGFKALSCFRNGNEAVDLAVVILRPIDIVWAVQPSSWASVKPDLDALYLQRNT